MSCAHKNLIGMSDGIHCKDCGVIIVPEKPEVAPVQRVRNEIPAAGEEPKQEETAPAAGEEEKPKKKKGAK